MKWLFATLVALNLIVFAAIIGLKVLDKYKPAQQTAAVSQQSHQVPVVVNVGGQSAITNPTNANGSNTASAQKTQITNPRPAPNNTKSSDNGVVPKKMPSETESAKAQYRACSARVSMPEDDYHRIKGLLGNFPHVATRQVIQGGGDGDSQTSSRMNILFMSADDQEAAAIQNVVGRYGQLNRTPCNK
ncbi:MAG: cell division protein [Alysiella sp.]|uniref:cell division protein n=1 Tax=Alysiella sp. TaxID=1872483 RepID=UPI0026DD8E05|nr:cell division protein [Alysiella sp.]MDO4433473.1 cell division protein [Alysiella sp.]